MSPGESRMIELVHVERSFTRGDGQAVLFARSATAGGQQFPVHWGGDCTATSVTVPTETPSSQTGAPGVRPFTSVSSNFSSARLENARDV